MGALDESFSDPVRCFLTLRMQTRTNVKLCFLSPTTEEIYSIPGSRTHEKKNISTATRSHPSLPHLRRTCIDYDTGGPGISEEAPTRSGLRTSFFPRFVTFQQQI